MTGPLSEWWNISVCQKYRLTKLLQGSGTLPPSRSPKGQPVRSEKRGGGGLSGVSGIDVHHGKGCRFGPDLRLAHFGGKEGKRVKGWFQPHKIKGFEGI